MTTAPTYADASATSRRSVETATVGVLIALSASHMLNDVMQSLAPALYPVFHRAVRAELLPDRPHYFRLPAHRLLPSAADRDEPGQAAAEFHPAGGHGLHAGRPGAAGFRQFLFADPALGGGGRHRQRRLPPRGVPRRPRGVRRPARLRAEPVSGRRELRPILGPAARGFHRRALRAAFGADLHGAGLGGGGHSDRRQPLVRRRSRPASQGGRGDGAGPSVAASCGARFLC